MHHTMAMGTSRWQEAAFHPTSKSAPSLGFHVDSIKQSSILGACRESASPLGTVVAVCWDVQATVSPVPG